MRSKRSRASEVLCVACERSAMCRVRARCYVSRASEVLCPVQAKCYVSRASEDSGRTKKGKEQGGDRAMGTLATQAN